MGTILLFIFLFIILIVMSLLSLVKGVTSAIFGRSGTSFSGSRPSDPYGEKERYNFQTSKKVFSENEGEYVKYEEIKE